MNALEKLTIRSFRKEDTAFAYEMTVKEEWNVTKADIERMLNYEPNGSFIAEANGSRIGHVFAVTYGRLGWLGLLIVRAEHRKKGAGTLLTKRAIDYMLDRGVQTIDLDAVPEISDLYRKLNFADRFDSLRLMGKKGRNVPCENGSATKMEKKEIAEVAKFDARYFGADRTRVLTGLHQAYPELCFVSRENSTVAGYAMCRKAESGYNMGPLVCNSEHVAGRLIVKCWNAFPSGEPIYIGVPAANEKAKKVLQNLGFRQYSKSIRMRFGKDLETERQSGIFGIGGPMKG
jgi:predicted N-acetyltransferase YhbS